MPSGIELARSWYTDRVAPALHGIPHAAALLGDGSEVLGFDDEVSTDHDFGSRVQIFVPEATIDRVERATSGLEGHGGHAGVETTTVERFFTERLGLDPGEGVTPRQWLALPTQRLAGLTAGAVFHDPEHELGRRRAVLTWYPDDVWRLALAAAWLRVSQHQAFVGRTGARGDDLGSRLVTARLVREHVRIAFLLERVWAPYDKWLGTAFARLPLEADVGPLLAAALAADTWRDREAALVAAGSQLLAATNRTGLAAAVDPSPRPYFTRDIRVVDADAAVVALVRSITSPDVRELVDGLQRGTGEAAAMPSIPGTIDQISDNVDVQTHPGRCATVAEGANRPS